MHVDWHLCLYKYGALHFFAESTVSVEPMETTATEIDLGKLQEIKQCPLWWQLVVEFV